MAFINFYKTVNNYCLDYCNQNNDNTEKIFDIESQTYTENIKSKKDTIIIFQNYQEYTQNNNNNNTNKYSIIGSGYDRIYGLEWNRINIYSDYNVYYKGFHIIPYMKIEQLLSNKIIKNYQFENVLKMYIDCEKNYELTLINFGL
jgi:hypothetical protein